MPSINTYYPQGLYDEMHEAANELYGDDPHKMDKLVKTAVEDFLKQLKEKKKRKQT